MQTPSRRALALRGLALGLSLAALLSGGVAVARVHRYARVRQQAAPQAPLFHAGRWITDRRGRVLILHGLNMVYKVPPYYPAAAGFDRDDAVFLRRFGFDAVRLGVIFKGVEPTPGAYNSSYVTRILGTERVLAKQGVFSLIDSHQDLYNEKFGGEGFPDWAVLDNGFPAQPLSGFPGSYISSPGLNEAFNSFWANALGPKGAGIQDSYAADWRFVATRFARERYVLGYDLLNEPWPGTVWPTCASTAGCPVFDQTELTPFSKRVIAQVRRADSRHLVFYEPNVIFDFGAATSHGSTGDARAAMSFHDYCLPGALGGPAGGQCGTFENLPFQNAEAQSQRTGDGLLLSEFGATSDIATLERVEGLADQHMMGWLEWHYCGCSDPTTQGPGSTQALVLDPRKPPTGSNVDPAKLAALARAYPQAIAGTPQAFSFDPPSRRFVLSYSTQRASGQGRLSRGLTQIFLPKLQYPSGYRVAVSGARVLSPQGSQQLILRNGRASSTVSVTVVPR